MADPRRRRLPIALFAVAAAIGTACAPTESTEPTPDGYAAAMEATCRDTAAELDALGTPPEESGHAEFAVAAATIIGDEAERAREIEAPDAAEDDHRAFIANTDDQASRWNELAVIAPDDAEELGRVSTEIAQLTLGRDELAQQMGLLACRRSGS
jgi:hypothetical protein